MTLRQLSRSFPQAVRLECISVKCLIAFHDAGFKARQFFVSQDYFARCMKFSSPGLRILNTKALPTALGLGKPKISPVFPNGPGEVVPHLYELKVRAPLILLRRS